MKKIYVVHVLNKKKTSRLKPSMSPSKVDSVRFKLLGKKNDFVFIRQCEKDCLFFLAMIHGAYPNTQLLPHPQLPSAPPLYNPQNNNDQYGKSQAPPLPSK